DRTDQHGLTLAVLTGDDVEHLVDAVAEVDVGHAGGTEHHAVALRASEPGMAREVLGAEIRLGLDDDAGAPLVDEHGADERPRDRDDVAPKPRLGQPSVA